MKKLPLLLFIAALAVLVYVLVFSKDGTIKIPLSQKSESSETAKSSHPNLNEFENIDISGVFHVDVTYGDEEKVEIEAPAHIKKDIKMKIKSKTLFFEMNNGRSIYSAGKVKVHITTARLNGFTISGASSLHLNNPLKDDSLSIHTSGAAVFSGEVYVQKADIKMEGASKMNVAGEADLAKIEMSGACQLNDYDLEIATLDVDLSGASSLHISAINSIVGNMSGASSLNYKGSPVVKMVEISGVSKLRKF